MSGHGPADAAPDELPELRSRLRRREAELEAARAEVAALTRELEETNRGLIALHAELEEARRAEAAAQAAQQVLADRERIARDLHDFTIQRIFAAGLSAEALASLVTSPTLSSRVQAIVDDLDAAIREIRTTIFGLQHGGPGATGLRAQVQESASRAAEGLGFEPRLRFDGPIDAVVPAAVGEQVLAVVREALSNVARHAHASAAEVTLSAGDDLVLRVVDNGRGLGQVTRSSGLRNLRERATALGGTFAVSGEGEAGVRLEWRVPLRRVGSTGAAPKRAAPPPP